MAVGGEAESEAGWRGSEAKETPQTSPQWWDYCTTSTPHTPADPEETRRDEMLVQNNNSISVHIN